MKGITPFMLLVVLLVGATNAAAGPDLGKEAVDRAEEFAPLIEDMVGRGCTLDDALPQGFPIVYRFTVRTVETIFTLSNTAAVVVTCVVADS